MDRRCETCLFWSPDDDGGAADGECRRILPRSVRWGESAWHPGPQWLLEAFDVDKGADRTFAFAGILEVRP